MALALGAAAKKFSIPGSRETLQTLNGVTKLGSIGLEAPSRIKKPTFCRFRVVSLTRAP